ncbi:uncharacterized protein EAF01_004285 [Botrytis porri]|uniref:uncharacterized protein n=1 Tax=Botrytis porri TaxID=87229 RepID=UPI00190108A8|nr:uncharacterized protein EAF01_004285 [Botrytis porri]KAF7908530.1 hypothetical protein EAF01_004285 [Botrytis porri]
MAVNICAQSISSGTRAKDCIVSGTMDSKFLNRPLLAFINMSLRTSRIPALLAVASLEVQKVHRCQRYILSSNYLNFQWTRIPGASSDADLEAELLFLPIFRNFAPIPIPIPMIHFEV